MEFRIEDGRMPAEGRFKDTHTTYMGRRFRLPVFWLDQERFALSLANAQRVVHSLDDARKLLSHCADMVDGLTNRDGLEGAALLLQEQCRKLMGWKANPKRDVPRRRRRAYYL